MKRFLAFVLVTAFAFVMVGSQAQAQGEMNYITPEKTIKYTLYEYPGEDTYFYLPPKFQVEFTTANAKFFSLQYNEFIAERDVDIDVYFYTPEDKLIGKVNLRATDAANKFSIPHKANTLLCPELKVKVVNKSKSNKDFKFVVFKPVSSVEGVPVPGSKYIYGEPVK